MIGATLVVLGVAGCGGGGESAKPAAQILSDAQAAAQAADSVHISGTVAQGGGAPGAATATIDLLLTSSGDGREQITGAGQSLDLIKVGQFLYVKGLGAPGAATGYQKLAVTDPKAAPLVTQLDMKSVFQQLVKTGSSPTIAGTDTVDGKAAVKIAPGGGVGVLYIADDAEHPYPLKVESSTATGATAQGPAGALMFTDWNAHTVISPPPNGGN